jgi:lauroyl/myristoyl acyltransferase
VRRFGLESVESSVSWARYPEELLQLRRQNKPVLLLGWHSGVPYGLAAGLSKEGLQALFCVGPPPPFKVPPSLTFVATSGGGLERAEALHQTLAHLRKGGLVYLVADSPTLSENRATLWGREVSMSPGVGLLAKVTGAAIIPVATRWTKTGGIEIVCGDSLSSWETERELYEKVGDWFEQRFCSHPEELEQKYMMRWLYCPEDPTASQRKVD